jgi:hypothetical protein
MKITEKYALFRRTSSGSRVILNLELHAPTLPVYKACRPNRLPSNACGRVAFHFSQPHNDVTDPVQKKSHVLFKD